MKFYDRDGDGMISYKEFIRGMREPLSERRSRIVLKAFRSLEKDH
jgi:Ca2+-binding EF-hand superfamily protein